MDNETLVDDLVRDGQRLVDELPKHGFAVSGALWLKASENNKWYFYIVSPVVDTDGPKQAYMRLHALVRATPEPSSINPLEIRLVGPSNPLGHDVIAIYQRSAPRGRAPISWGGTWLGGASIEQAVVYPLATTP